MRKNNEMVSTKSNALIQNYAWKLKKYELKIFEFVCCCYDTKYYDAEKNQIIISINDFANECDCEELKEGGTYYTRFKKSLKKLSDTSIEIVKENGDESLLRIINKYDIKKNKSEIICHMSDDYKLHMDKHPLGNAFIELKIINKMTSKYSINLYNLIRSWDGLDEIILDIDYLKEKLCCTSSTYNNISLLKQTIDFAINEINQFSNLFVSYTTKKTGRKISTFVFNINKKNNSSSAVIENKKDIMLDVDKNIDYEYLKDAYFPNASLIELMRNIIIEILQSTEKTIKISQTNYPACDVKKVFNQVNSKIILDILNNINEQQTTKKRENYIAFPKEYLKSALYHSTIAYIDYTNNIKFANMQFNDII